MKIFMFFAHLLTILLEVNTLVSERQNYINSCCLTQFAYNHGECYHSKSFDDSIYFPKTLFGKRFRSTRLTCNETRRVFVHKGTFEESLSQDGSFHFDDQLFSTDEYCVDSIGPIWVEVITISKLKCKGAQNLKCCNENEFFDLGRRECYQRHPQLTSSPPPSPWSRKTNKEQNLSKFLKNCNRVINFTSINCWKSAVRFEIHPGREENNSTLKYESFSGVFVRGKWETLHEPFCIEKMTNFESVCKSRSHEAEIIFYCAEVENTSPHVYALVMGCLWIGTSALLLITAILNVFIVQKNSHGWVLFCYLMTSCLLNCIAGIFILIVDEHRNGCNFIDFATKFLYSSTLCWMTMVNFDLWWAFRKMETTTQRNKKWLLYYCLFSWTIPMCIVCVCWVVGRSRGKTNTTYCILYDQSLILYSSGPIVFLIILNLCLFLRTAITIQEIRMSTRAVLQNTRRVQKESFRLFTKLFLMSGPIWIFRVILLGLQFQGNYLTWYGITIETIFSIPDIVFFLLVVFHPKVVKRFQETLPCLRDVSGWLYTPSVIVRNSISQPDALPLRQHVGHSSLQRKTTISLIMQEHAGNTK